MNKKFVKPTIIGVMALAIIGGALSFGLNHTKAEQSGSTPESGVTSRILSLYNDLTGLTYGSDSDTPDWGAYWNRIKTAAKWVPSGTAVEADVATGKTFYNTTRGAKTGAGTVTNLTPAGPCPNQQYHDSYGAPVTESTNCSLTWTTNSSPQTGDDNLAGRGGYDPRTGLTWSQYLKNNAGTVEFAASGGSTWNWDGTLRFTVTAATAAVGDTYTNNGQTFTVGYTIAGATTLYAKPASSGLPAASGNLVRVTGSGTDPIVFSTYTLYGSNVAVGSKTASQLCSERGNGWRLPTQKELMQAYIDGSYFNLTQPSDLFWSAAEYSSTLAWFVPLNVGNTNLTNKSTSSTQVRCVR
jgi:hypothetical protein